LQARCLRSTHRSIVRVNIMRKLLQHHIVVLLLWLSSSVLLVVLMALADLHR